MRCRGFTLVESLVALLLLSIGLLGAGALLLQGLQSHGEALRQTAALNLVRDLAGRIRANPRARAFYDTRETAAVDGCSPDSPCDPAARAGADRAYFAREARRLFPGDATRAQIVFLPATGSAAPDRYTISLHWRDPRDSQSAAPGVIVDLLALPVAG